MATQSRLTVFDTERAATLGLKDGAIYTLPPCALPYGELEATSEPVTEPAPAQLDKDVRSAVGYTDDGVEHAGHVPRALQEAYALRKAGPRERETVLASFFGVPAAFDESVIDLLRGWGVAWPTIDNYMGRQVDRTVKRLIEPGSLARAADEIEAATKAAVEADKVRAKTQNDFAERIDPDAVVPPGQYWQVIDLPTDRLPDPTPVWVDDLDRQWNAYELLPGMECHLRSKPERLILKPGDPLPIPNRARKTAPLPITFETYQLLKKAQRIAKKGQPNRARPETPTLRHRELGLEIIQTHVRHLVIGFNTVYGHALPYTVEALVRGLGLPVATVIEDITAAITRAGHGKYPYGAYGRDVIAETAVKAYSEDDPGMIPWMALAPLGVVDRVAERVSSWTEPLRRFFLGKPKVSSAEIAAELGLEEVSPHDHIAIHRIATEAGLLKRRVQVGGAREHFFIKQ